MELQRVKRDQETKHSTAKQSSMSKQPEPVLACLWKVEPVPWQPMELLQQKKRILPW